MLIGVINDRDQKALLAKKGRMVRGEIVRYETSKMPSQTLGNVLIGAMAGVIGVLFALILQKSRKEKPKPQRRTKIRYQFTSPASGKVLSKTEKFVGMMVISRRICRPARRWRSITAPTGISRPCSGLYTQKRPAVSFRPRLAARVHDNERAPRSP